MVETSSNYVFPRQLRYAQLISAGRCQAEYLCIIAILMLSPSVHEGKIIATLVWALPLCVSLFARTEANVQI